MHWLINRHCTFKNGYLKGIPHSQMPHWTQNSSSRSARAVTPAVGSSASGTFAPAWVWSGAGAGMPQPKGVKYGMLWINMDRYM